MMNRKERQRGFVALMTAIVMSAMLLVLMAGSGYASFYARYDALGVEKKREAQALAESCVNVALLALATSSDPEHFSESNIAVAVASASSNSSNVCTVDDVRRSGADMAIQASASVDDSYSTVRVVATLPPSISIVSWDISP